jgi:general secretion pathway protein A
MYHQFFGLDEAAFSIAVNPKFLYMSEQHREALAHLLYGVKGGGFVLLSGEVGAGKTTIIRCLLQQLPADTEVAFILNPMAEVRDLMHAICEELHIEVPSDDCSIKRLSDLLQQKLLDNHSKGKRSVLLIDEAQLLSVDVLEQIRLLTNLETATEKLLNIILVAQPEIQTMLAQPRLRQLSQRITARFHIEPLSMEDCRRYIEHRLRIAGKKGQQDIFPSSIIKKIHRFSGGIPRLVNILCERCLIGAYAHNSSQVNAKVYRMAYLEVAGTAPAKASSRSPALIWAAILVLLMAGLALFAIPLIAHRESIEISQTSEALTPADTEQVPVAPAEGKFVFEELNDAYAVLFAYHDLVIQRLNHPCWNSQNGYKCGSAQLEGLAALTALSRPGVAEIHDGEGVRHIVVIGLQNSEVVLLDDTFELQFFSRARFAREWSGTFYYLWQRPAGFETPLAQGQRSAVVKWVAKAFAELDGQQNPLSEELFNSKLKQRIEHFQSEQGLEIDGVIGERTLMKLQDIMGVSKRLILNFDASSTNTEYE